MRGLSNLFISQIQKPKLYSAFSVNFSRIARMNQRFFSSESIVTQLRNVPGAKEHKEIEGLFTIDEFLTPDEHQALATGLYEERRKVYDAYNSNRYTKTFHQKTGKTSYDISYQDSREQKELSVNLFIDYHEGTELIHGYHEAITYPSELPSVIEIITRPLSLSKLKLPFRSQYLFMNKYIMPNSAPDAETVFDFHKDLKRFTGEFSIIYILSGDGDLQFALLPEKDKNKDGFLKPDPNSPIWTLPANGGMFIMLSGKARHEMVHRVIMKPNSERESFTLGFKVDEQVNFQL